MSPKYREYRSFLWENLRGILGTFCFAEPTDNSFLLHGSRNTLCPSNRTTSSSSSFSSETSRRFSIVLRFINSRPISSPRDILSCPMGPSRFTLELFSLRPLSLSLSLRSLFTPLAGYFIGIAGRIVLFGFPSLATANWLLCYMNFESDIHRSLSKIYKVTSLTTEATENYTRPQSRYGLSY